MNEITLNKDIGIGDERARRAIESPISMSSTEVKEKIQRRRFTDAYKQRILQKVLIFTKKSRQYSRKRYHQI